MLIRQFIAFLFASVLMAHLGHNIVPHHHHIDSIFSHQGCQDQDNGNAFHAGDPSGHCHAFNGIEYYPAPDKQDISKPFKAVKYIYLSQVIELNKDISDQELFRPSRGSPPVFTYLLGSSTGLRAPPLAA
jgi:hypothetical protein